MTAAPVPFLDLSPQFSGLQDEWLASIRNIGASGAFVLGPNVAEFEQEFARYTGTNRAVALANGTDALVLSLRALNVGPGDEVITTPYTFFASAEAINMVGAKPVFVDIEPASFNLDPQQIEPAITARTRAILPVHIFGHPADMNLLCDLADTHGLRIIEDCAQACGAQIHDKKVGSFGATGTFSFYPTKVLGCYGDGGMVTTDDPELEQKLRKLRNHCAISSFIHDDIGFNSRLDEIQASLLRIKLAEVETAIAARQQVVAWYAEGLAGTDAITPGAPEDGRHVFNLYTVRVPRRDRVRQHLADAGIGFSVCYPQPLHLQPVYRSLGYNIGDLPESELAARQCISLPIFPGMQPEQVDRVCEVVKQ